MVTRRRGADASSLGLHTSQAVCHAPQVGGRIASNCAPIKYKQYDKMWSVALYEAVVSRADCEPTTAAIAIAAGNKGAYTSTTHISLHRSLMRSLISLYTCATIRILAQSVSMLSTRCGVRLRCLQQLCAVRGCPLIRRKRASISTNLISFCTYGRVFAYSSSAELRKHTVPRHGAGRAQG